MFLSRIPLGKCWANWRNTGFTSTRGRRIRRHDVDFDDRHLIDAQRRVGVVVGLIDSAIGQGNRLAENRAQAEADAALHLGHHLIGVDRRAAINRADDALDLDLAWRRNADRGP